MNVAFLKAMLDSPGTASLLQEGLESEDSSESAAIIIANLCRCEAAASAIVDGHQDLVRTLIESFGTSSCSSTGGNSNGLNGVGQKLART